MAGVWQKWWWRWLAREACVPVSECVHFCGFRYGTGEIHPYESPMRALVRGEPAVARAELMDFFRHYRPRHFAEALGTATEATYPLWLYPWSRHAVQGMGWTATPDDCPDILTHFAEQGIPLHRIDAEFGWLQRALTSIREHGFQPQRFKSHLAARRLVRADGSSAWLVLDGNHRLAALAALGESRVRVRYLPVATVRETALPRWRQVRNGVYSASDALVIWEAYFTGNRRPRTTDAPAWILEEQI